MRLLAMVVAVVSPVLFGQGRGAARVAPAPVVSARPAAPPAPSSQSHRTIPPPTNRVTATPPVGSRTAAPPAGPGRGGFGQGGRGGGSRPVYFLGYYWNPFYYGPGYAAGPPPGDSAPAPPYYGADPNGQGYPSVLVNPSYTPESVNPVLRDYSNVPTPDDVAAQAAGQSNDQNGAPRTPSVIFLVAMRDHTIYPAIAFWVEDDTLNYITEQGVHNRVSLALVDREFSAQLNRERNLDFVLPASKEN